MSPCSYFSSILLLQRPVFVFLFLWMTSTLDLLHIFFCTQEGLINEEWLSVDYPTAFTHFIAAHASCCPASFLNSAIILMAPAQRVAFGDPGMFFPWSNTVNTFPSCIYALVFSSLSALPSIYFSFVFLIQKHFSNWSKHILIFLMLSKVLIPLWIVVIITLYNDAIFYSDHWFKQEIT